jgi:PA14 domain
MLKITRCLLALGLFLLAGSTALAQGPSPQHSDPMWQVSYWANKYMKGTPVLERSEVAIDHDWGADPPGPGIESDAFSARWTRYIDVSTARSYRFNVICDDGMRVFVDNALILDEWHDQPAMGMAVDKYLDVGHHQVVVEYYENAYAAVAKFWMSPDVPSAIVYWKGEYFNNTTLSGASALVRDDTNLNFHWNEDTPAPGIINADNFSVRWTRNLDLPAGPYRFYLTVDDGARLWVNGQLLIDSWKDQWVQTYTADLWLPGGSVPIKLEYYEHTGGAFADLSWEAFGTIRNWRGEYYNNMTLSGSPALMRDDVAINFDWGNGSPAPGTVSADHFSARWTRNLDFPAGTYHFALTADDGVRLWVNGHLLIDAWKDQSPTAYGGDIYLPGGSVPLKLEYYENEYGATVKLSWGVPVDNAAHTVIVDNASPGFERGGRASSWHSAPGGFGNSMVWTFNSNIVHSGYNWGRWYPALQAGRYEVFALIPDLYSTTSRARYWVSHAGGLALRIVDQNSVGNRWLSLGTYQFAGTRADYVSLSDVTYEPNLTRMVAWDAMKWEPR